MPFYRSTIAHAALAALAVTSAYSVPAVAQEARASGEVRRVNADEGKITLQHGAIKDLGLEAMTLVYKADPSLLAGLQPGDKVKFTARRENGEYVVTAISK